MKIYNNSPKTKIAMLLAVLLLGASVQKAFAFSSLSTQMDLGSRGVDVGSLQTFLASNSNIYPQGLVTGYFGQLTRRAVENFQVAYDLPMAGRVGPLTLGTINRVINSGHGIDISAPVMSNKNVSLSSGRATISWFTNEGSMSKVFYDTRPIATAEASMSFTEPNIYSAFVATSLSFVNNQSITLQNLTPGAQYYYYAESIDASGNVSVSTQGTFTAI